MEAINCSEKGPYLLFGDQRDWVDRHSAKINLTTHGFCRPPNYNGPCPTVKSYRFEIPAAR